MQGDEGLQERSAKKLKTNELLIPKWAAFTRAVSWSNSLFWRDHVSVKQLAGDRSRTFSVAAFGKTTRHAH